MTKAIKSTYVTTWKIEPLRIARTVDVLEKMARVAATILEAQTQHENLIWYANSEAGHLFPSLRANAIREAAEKIQAQEKLRRYFNKLANELQL